MLVWGRRGGLAMMHPQHSTKNGRYGCVFATTAAEPSREFQPGWQLQLGGARRRRDSRGVFLLEKPNKCVIERIGEVRHGQRENGQRANVQRGISRRVPICESMIC